MQCPRCGRDNPIDSGYAEARGHFEDALGALAHLPDTRETKVQGIDLRLDARAALAPLGQYGQILDRMREAETLAREIDDRRRLGLVLADIGARLRNLGEHARALEATRQALDIARELEDADLAIEATYRLAQAHFAVGDLVEAGVLFQEVAQSHTDNRPASALPPFFAAWPRAWLALTLAQLGRFTEATVHAEDAIRIAELVAHPHTVVESHAALGGVSLERGDLGTARRTFEHVVALLQARNARDANVMSGLGYAYVLSGRLSEGLPLLEESVRGEVWISSRGLGLAVCVARLAEAYSVAGRAGEALEHARTAVDLSRKHQERANEASALRVLADIIACSDPLDPQAARDTYAASLALAEALGMRPLLAHCHRGLAELCGRTGQRQQVEEQLRIAAAGYRELGMTHWLEQT